MTNRQQSPVAKFPQVGPNAKCDFVGSKVMRGVDRVSLQRNGTIVFMLAVITFISVAFASGQIATYQVVPSVINYSGVLTDNDGKPLTGPEEVTFSLYKSEQGGGALWMESQRVETDKQGNYTVTLGSTTVAGMPATLFAAGEARWLGIEISGRAEQPRVMLLAVPYAMKAGDAETLGGLPASSFMHAGVVSNLVSSGTSSAATSPTAGPAGLSAATSNVTTAGGTAGAIPVFTTSTNIQNSILTQSGTVAVNVSGRLNLPSNGTATATAGRNSRPEDFVASSFNSGTGAAVAQTFQLQAEPAGNDTGSPSGTLSLLFGSGTSAPTETGLKINNRGILSFAAGQTFPGTGKGTITGVTAGTALTGGGTSGSVTLNVDTTKVPQLKSNNSFTGTELFAGNVGVGTGPSSTGYTPLTVGGVTNFGTWFAIGNSSAGGHTWNIISAGSGNAEGAGNLGITDLTGKSTIWLEGNTNVSGTLNVSSSNNPLASSTITAQGYDGSAGITATGGNGDSSSQTADGSGGVFMGASNYCCGNGIEAYTGSYLAGYFDGNVYVNGSIDKLSGSFKIDHPLDPANKYLYHSFVESPDMMNIYNGNVVTDATGNATIPLPEWFEALNRDFRYQLTVIGQFAQAIVVQKVSQHRFGISTDKPGVEVSWQVTGIRQDAWANAHRIPVEEEKDARDRGHYIRPELYGAPEEASVSWARHPATMRKLKQLRDARRGSATQSRFDARRALPSN